MATRRPAGARTGAWTAERLAHNKIGQDDRPRRSAKKIDTTTAAKAHAHVPASAADGGNSASLLLFGGPYSNVHALSALRERAEALGIAPQHCICTGDVVAYCGEPEATVALIRAWGCHVIAGNCEEQLAQLASDCGCGFEKGSECDRLAQGWYGFAMQRVSADDRAWMGALPKTLAFSLAGLRVRIVHGGLDIANHFIFASEPAVIAEQLERSGADVVVAGHAGIPFIKKTARGIWFNPGALGMPANDGTPEVWYGRMAVGREIVLSTHRLAYDHEAAAASMRRSGHAEAYARALISGRWPSLDVLPPAERAASGRRLRPHRLAIPARAAAIKQPSERAR